MKRRLASWLLAVCLAVGLLPAGQGLAQSFEEGYQSYMRNQFPVAELQFRGALKKAKSKDDRAFILKFIGICQFMRGDKKSSANSFYEALNMDRNVTIDEEEVLDPGVVSFFNVIKTRWSNSPEGMAAMAAAAPKPAPAPAPAKAAPAPAPKAVAQEPVPRPTAAETKTAPAPTPAPAADKSRKRRYGTRSISWMHFAPFGLGQFYNESYVLGSAIAAGQVYTIYQYSFLTDQIKKERQQNDEVFNNPNILQDDKDKFLLDNASYIEDLKTDKTHAAIAFLLLYTGSVVEGLIFAPKTHFAEGQGGPETSKKLPRKSINTGWLPNRDGGTYLVSWKMQLD